MNIRAELEALYDAWSQRLSLNSNDIDDTYNICASEIRRILDDPDFPKWRDAPTRPGNWCWTNDTGSLDGGNLIEQDLPIAAEWGIRWYGPIPEDKK